MHHPKTTLLTLACLAALTGCDDAPADPAAVTVDDPERELAEQELQAEAEAQETNRQTREGLQRAADQLQEEKGDDGYAGMFGGNEEQARRRQEKQQAARDAKAKAAGFDTWEEYQQSLNDNRPATRPG